MKTILRLAAEREELRIIADQIGAPTSAELLADVSALCLHDVLFSGEKRLSGTYHLVAKGETSWHGFANFIVAEAQAAGHPLRCSADKIAPITTAEYPLPATRPANSRLATNKLETNFNLSLPDWQWHAQRTLKELLQP